MDAKDEQIEKKEVEANDSIEKIDTISAKIDEVKDDPLSLPPLTRALTQNPSALPDISGPSTVKKQVFGFDDLDIDDIGKEAKLDDDNDKAEEKP